MSLQRLPVANICHTAILTILVFIFYLRKCEGSLKHYKSFLPQAYIRGRLAAEEFMPSEALNPSVSVTILILGI